MKKIFIMIPVFLIQFCVYAAECDTLDVFEEFAVSDAQITTEDFSVTAEKNKSVNGMLKYTAEIATVSFEITEQPTNGKVEITDYKGSFTYTPNKDFSGTDSFAFRIKAGGEESNISRCTVNVTEQKDDTEELGFVYEDMRTHWGNYSAVKLVERDIVKGERIGKRYYFHPETNMRRLDVAEYILAAMKADFDTVDKNETHIFEDSASLPEYVNEAGYLANKKGFLAGVRDGEKVYFKPYEYINRAEIIRMIDLAMSSKTQNGDEIKFADENSIPDWAVQSVKNLVGYGIVKGFEDNTLRPFDKITKAQTAEMIYQMMKYNEENSVGTISARIRHEIYGNYIA